MTATYDPTDPKYFDPGALREELDRVFDLCHGCRLCFNLCPSFPSLFSFIDENDGDVTKLSDAQRNQVVDECYQCKLCYVKCPYVPPHEWELDFPRLMSRVHAVRQKQLVSVKERVTDQFLGRTDALGRASVMAEPVVNWATGTPGSWTRKLMEKTVGIASERLLPPVRQAALHDLVQGAAGGRAAASGPAARSRSSPPASSSTWSPTSGKAIVEVYEHNGVTCSLPGGTKCCGAPWLHSGKVEQFEKEARRNVAALASAVRAGKDVVVAQPTCAYVLKKDYPLYVGTPDADLVAAHTYDPAEYLMKRHRDPDDAFELRDEFPGVADGSVPAARDLPRGLPPAGPERRAAQPRPAQGGRGEVHAWCSAARASTAPGATARRTTSWPARWRGRSGARSRRRATRSCAVTATWPTAPSRRRRVCDPVHPMQLLAQAYGSIEGGRASTGRTGRRRGGGASPQALTARRRPRPAGLRAGARGVSGPGDCPRSSSGGSGWARS